MKNKTNEELLKENLQLRSKIQNCEDILHVLIKNSKDIITLHDDDGRYTYYKGASGYPQNKDQFIGKFPSDIFEEEESKKIISAIKKAFNSGKSSQFESTLNWEGQQKIFSVKIYPIFKDDTVVAAAKICRDITEHINIKNSLFESEERYRLVVDATENGIWDWSINTNEVYYSDQWKAQLGYQPDELKNEFKTWEDLLHPDCKKRAKQSVVTFLENPTNFFIEEFRLKHKDGSYRWIYNKAIALLDENGKAFRMLGAHLDITERKKTELELKESKNYLENLTNSMTDIVFSVKMPEREIEWVNNSIKSLGYNHKECIGENTSFLYPDLKSYKEFGFKLSESLANGSVFFQTKQVLKRKNGETFIAEVSISFIRKNNEVVNVTSIIKDITHRIEEERELKKYRNSLEELIAERTSELKEKNRELDNTLLIFIGREQKIQRLENKIKLLEA